MSGSRAEELSLYVLNFNLLIIDFLRKIHQMVRRRRIVGAYSRIHGRDLPIERLEFTVTPAGETFFGPYSKRTSIAQYTYEK